MNAPNEAPSDDLGDLQNDPQGQVGQSYLVPIGVDRLARAVEVARGVGLTSEQAGLTPGCSHLERKRELQEDGPYSAIGYPYDS
jgi:hypothetical protein